LKKRVLLLKAPPPFHRIEGAVSYREINHRIHAIQVGKGAELDGYFRETILVSATLSIISTVSKAGDGIGYKKFPERLTKIKGLQVQNETGTCGTNRTMARACLSPSSLLNRNAENLKC
jgi:hypothetical protein